MNYKSITLTIFSCTMVGLLTGILILSCKSRNHTDDLDLKSLWKFQVGDDGKYSRADYNDANWKSMRIDTFWEYQGLANYNGIVWYRKHIVIPSSLKKNGQLLQSLRISLGKIDDADVTYLNGTKIGENSTWDADRNYLVPWDLVNWDKENTIAIKVTDNAGNGGMYGGPHTIGKVRLADIVTLQALDKPAEFSLPNSNFTRTIQFHFKTSIEKISGRLTTKIYQPITQSVIFEKSEEISIGKKADSLFRLNVKLRNPGSYRIDYSFSIPMMDTINYNTLFSYVLIQHKDEHRAVPIVKPVIQEKVVSFNLEDIQVEGYLGERMKTNLMQRLLQIDETGILECYYNRPGNQTWIGEYAGKYLHAASRSWLTTHNSLLKVQMDRIADILIGCQNSDGYLGTYLPAGYWKEWDVWAHKYNLLGLLSYYSATGYPPALEASVKIGNLLCKTFGEEKGQQNIILSSPHLGMASTSVLEPMTELYRYTGEIKYLNFCNYIIKAYEYENGPKITSTLLEKGKVDQTADGKAYEMMSNFTGMVKLYQLTGNKKLIDAVKNAWKDISEHKLYITGTASEGECFQFDFVLPAENENHMGEGCVTVTWLQFNQALYNLTGDVKYIDEIEKSIYNHLLAAENPRTGCVSYYTALQGKKNYRCTIFGNCCLASVPRGISAIPELIYTKNTDYGLNINIYTSGKFTGKIYSDDGKEESIECNINSEFPKEGSATITFNFKEKKRFPIKLRTPIWCRNFEVTVQDKKYTGHAGEYLVLDDEWEKNMILHVSFDLNLQFLDGGKSYPGYEAVKRGPQILAIDQALNPEIEELDEIILETPKLIPISQKILPEGWIGTQLYSSKGIYRGNNVDLKLVPFADAGQTGGEVRVWIKKRP